MQNMKCKFNHRHGLGGCVVALLIACVWSIARPLRFEAERKTREKAVQERMSRIWEAQQQYRKVHGVYTSDLSVLVKAGLLADTLRYIPFSEGVLFQAKADVTLTKSGGQIPELSLSAPYSAYLNGMNANSIANLVEQANYEGRFPGVELNTNR